MPDPTGFYVLLWLLAVVAVGVTVLGAIGALVVRLFRRIRSGEVRSRGGG